jgi:acyl-CoA dehydrogenase
MIRNPNEFSSFLDSLKKYCKNKLIPREAEVALLDEVPADIVSDMAEFGLFGFSIPEAYGGLGMTTEELALAAIELSQCSVAFRARVGTNTGIGSEALVADGSESQKAKYLPSLASGKVTGCFAITEPDAGSDASSLKTSAIKDGNDYILNGIKCFITNAPISDLFTVMARTDQNKPKADGVSAFFSRAKYPWPNSWKSL